MDPSSPEQSSIDCSTDAHLMETLILDFSSAIQTSPEELSNQQSTDLSTETQTDNSSTGDVQIDETLENFRVIFTPEPVHDHDSPQPEMGQAQVTNIVEEHMQQGGVEVIQIEMGSCYPDAERVTNTTEARTTCVESRGADNIDLRILPQGKTKRKKGKEKWVYYPIFIEEQPKEDAPDIPINSTELDYDGHKISVNVTQLDNALSIGSGQFGVVYAVNIPELGGIPMAVKCMIRERDEHGFSSAETELATMKTVGTGDNPYIIEYYGAMINPVANHLCIWMEWMNATVEDFNRTRLLIGEIAFDKVDFLLRRVTHNIVSGLWFLEMKGLLHRDVKPANMLINLNAQIKLCDFGICCSVSESSILTGTPAYLPPIYENCAIQNDMWALGISLLEIISGKNPFADWNSKEIAFRLLTWEPAIPITISRHMQKLISDLLEKRARDRPHSYTDILDQFANYNVIWTPSNAEYAFVRHVIENIIPAENIIAINN